MEFCIGYYWQFLRYQSSHSMLFLGGGGSSLVRDRIFHTHYLCAFLELDVAGRSGAAREGVES